MRIIIINGPNLNLLGKRAPETYGTRSFDTFFSELKKKFPKHTIDYYQSNIEGEIIDCLHRSDQTHDAVILNPGAYAHTSVAISDAVEAIGIPVVEVHISNIYTRDMYRQDLIIASQCKGVIIGFGLKGYELAVSVLLNDS